MSTEKIQTQTPAKTQTPEPVGRITYAYTQHDLTVTVIERTCGVNIIRLKQDRTKDPVEDVLAQVAIPHTVIAMPYYDDRFIEENIKQKARV